MRDLVKRAREAVEGVTPGPWVASKHSWPEQVGCCPLIGRPLSAHHDMRNVAAANTEADIQFIAAARDLIPEMADEIERLRAELLWVRERMSGFCGGSWESSIAKRIDDALKENQA
jgi:hypothetical protein